MAGNAGGGLSSNTWRYGRDGNRYGVGIAFARRSIFPAQFLFKGESGIRGWLDAFDDWVISGYLSLFFDFVRGSFGGVCGRDYVVGFQKNKEG